MQPFVHTATGPGPAVDAFSSLLSATDADLGDGPLADAVATATGGAEMRRVVCTSEDGGGNLLAVLCGTWAGLHYPTANVDVVTFGPAWVSLGMGGLIRDDTPRLRVDASR